MSIVNSATPSFVCTPVTYPFAEFDIGKYSKSASSRIPSSLNLGVILNTNSKFGVLYPSGASVSINVYVPSFNPDIWIFPASTSAPSFSFVPDEVNSVASSLFSTSPVNFPFSSNVAYFPFESFNMNFAPFNVSSFEFFFVISNVNEYT